MFSENFKGDVFGSVGHIFMLLFLIVGIILIIGYGNKIKKNSKTDKSIRYSLALLMIYMEVIFEIWNISNGHFTLWHYLDWCYIAMVLSIINLFNKNEKLFKIICAGSIMGAMLSITVVQVEYTFPHYRYFHYFLGHILFFLGIVYLFKVHKFRLTVKDQLFTSLVIAVITAPFIIIANITKRNIFFFLHLPKEVDFLLNWSGIMYPFVWMIVVMIIMFIIATPFIIITRIQDKRKLLD